MTLMLSVAGTAEVDVAIAGGADIVELRDPARGAFGAADPATLAPPSPVAGRRSLSVVLGELPMQPQAVHDAAASMAQAGPDYLAFALDPRGDVDGVLHALAPLAARCRLIAETQCRNPDLGLVAAAAGIAGAMLDTAEKRGPGLLGVLDLPVLRRFVVSCRDHGLLSGLAGELEAPDVPRVLVLDPGMIGFRGALCGEAGRSGPIDPAAVAEIRALIPLQTPHGRYARLLADGCIQRELPGAIEPKAPLGEVDHDPRADAVGVDRPRPHPAGRAVRHDRQLHPVPVRAHPAFVWTPVTPITCGRPFTSTRPSCRTTPERLFGSRRITAVLVTSAAYAAPRDPTAFTVSPHPVAADASRRVTWTLETRCGPIPAGYAIWREFSDSFAWPPAPHSVSPAYAATRSASASVAHSHLTPPEMLRKPSLEELPTFIRQSYVVGSVPVSQQRRSRLWGMPPDGGQR